MTRLLTICIFLAAANVAIASDALDCLLPRPKTAGDVWKYDWLATFVPVTKGPHPKEVQGLEFSSQPMN
jgi:hypothetical protein